MLTKSSRVAICDNQRSSTVTSILSPAFLVEAIASLILGVNVNSSVGRNLGGSEGRMIRGLTETCATNEFDCHRVIFKSLSKCERHTCSSMCGDAIQPSPGEFSLADTMLRLNNVVVRDELTSRLRGLPDTR
jgi:hypothetical protein